MLKLNDISEDEALSFLPSEFVELFAPVLSLESMLRLINEHGGENIYISSCTLSGMPEKDIHAICGVAGGSIIDVPNGNKLRLHMRNQEILRLVDSGTLYNTISRQYNLTQRHLRKIVQKLRAKQSQSMQ